VCSCASTASGSPSTTRIVPGWSSRARTGRSSCRTAGTSSPGRLSSGRRSDGMSSWIRGSSPPSGRGDRSQTGDDPRTSKSSGGRRRRSQREATAACPVAPASRRPPQAGGLHYRALGLSVYCWPRRRAGEATAAGPVAIADSLRRRPVSGGRRLPPRSRTPTQDHER
jgi:hypothetical protein